MPILPVPSSRLPRPANARAPGPLAILAPASPIPGTPQHPEGRRALASELDTDLLIIGGGIAGPAVAAALHARDLSITLLERSHAPLDTARGDHLQPHTLEILERWGAREALLAAGAEPRRGTHWFDPSGEPLLHLDLGTLPVQFPEFRFLDHERISEVLLAVARRNPRFRLVRPLQRWEPLDDGRLRVTRREEEDLLIGTRLLIGADGAASGVRRALGVEATTLRYEHPIGVLFGRWSAPNPGNDLQVHLGQDRIVSAIPRTGGACKIGLPLKRSELERWRSLDADGLRLALRALAPALAVEGLRFDGLYPPTRVLAQRWIGALDRSPVSTPAALVGDACHAMHPARSQGMNIAIQNIDVLLDALPDDPHDWDTQGLGPALARYDGEIRHRMELRLHDNHVAGQLMDAMSAEANAQLMQRLRAVAEDEDKLRAYAISTAGYG